MPCYRDMAAGNVNTPEHSGSMVVTSMNMTITTHNDNDHSHNVTTDNDKYTNDDYLYLWQVIGR